MTGIQTLAGIFLIFTLLISITRGNDAAWALMKNSHNLTFKSSKEETRKRNIFIKNLNIINEHNTNSNGESTFTVGMNKFSFMSNTEMSNYKGYIPNDPSLLKGLKSSVNYKSPIQSNSPNSDSILGSESQTDTGMDSRNHPCQRPIDNQGNCGSCYAFSTCHQFHFTCCLINFPYFNGTFNTHAEQELVSCSRPYGNNGCSGGSMLRSYNYINESGIANRVDYPYNTYESSCKASSYYDFMAYAGIYVSDVFRVPQNNFTALEDAIRQNIVVSAAICTNDTKFQLYTGGIYYSSSCNCTVDHGILIVGFTNAYWIVKNSWGSQWGMNGYIYIGRNNPNNCGLGMMTSFASLRLK